MGFFSDIFDPGRRDREAAAGAAQQGIIEGTSATGPGGIQAGFDFSDNQATVTSDLGSFTPTMEGLQGLSAQGLTQAGGGLPPELAALASGTIDRLGQTNVEQMSGASDFAGLGQVFQSSLGTAQADPFELGAGISQKLRQLSERRNTRLVNKTFDRLKRSGKLGTSGGAGIAGELDANLQDQDLKFDLAGLQAGSQMQRDAFGRLTGASAAREGIGSRAFAESFGLEQLGGQRALQQFGVGNTMFDSFLRNQQQGANIGIAGAQAAAGVSQLPRAFLQAANSSAGLASGTHFGEAGVHGQSAAMAKSPFLEALNAAGSFATGIAPLRTPAGG